MGRKNLNEATFGEKMSPVLQEMEKAIWEHEAYFPDEPPGYTKEDLRAAAKIFMSVFWDRMFAKMMLDGTSLETSSQMVQKAGEEMRKFILAYTGLDMHQLTKEWMEEGK